MGFNVLESQESCFVGILVCIRTLRPSVGLVVRTPCFHCRVWSLIGKLNILHALQRGKNWEKFKSKSEKDTGGLYQLLNIWHIVLRLAGLLSVMVSVCLFVYMHDTPWLNEFMQSFPCGSAGKESACNAVDLGSISGLERSPGEGKGYPLQYSSLENCTDYIVRGVAKRWTWLSNF